MPFLVYFPLTGFFGGWDDQSLSVLETASKMSGPGKPFAVFLYKSLKKACSHSKFHNRFKMDEANALKEAEELMLIKIEKTNSKVRIGKIQ